MATLGLSKVFILDKYFTELQKYWETEKKLQGKQRIQYSSYLYYWIFVLYKCTCHIFRFRFCFFVFFSSKVPNLKKNEFAVFAVRLMKNGNQQICINIEIKWVLIWWMYFNNIAVYLSLLLSDDLYLNLVSLYQFEIKRIFFPDRRILTIMYIPNNNKGAV